MGAKTIARMPPKSVAWQKHGASLSFCITFLLLLATGCAPKPSNRLIVGMELNYPPFEMVDTKREPVGISVEMAQALGRYLGREVQIENIPFDGLIPALKTGKIDLIISSMTETAERAQSIDFSEPYLRTGLCMLVSKSATYDSVDGADQPGLSIAVKQGTTGQVYAKEHFKNARVLVLDKEDACVLEVVQGKAAGFIYDQMSVFKHWQQHKESTRALLRPFKAEQWAIGIRKGREDLKEKVNAFLRDFKTSRGFDKLADQFLGDQKQEFEKLGIPFYF